MQEEQSWAFRLGLAKKDLLPDKVSVHDLASLLDAVHHMMQPDYSGEIPEKKDRQQDLIVSLVGVEPGSTNLAFAVDDEDLGQKRFSGALRVINNRLVSPKDRRKTQEFLGIARRLNTPIELYPAKTDIPAAVIDPNEEEMGETSISGDTVLYGKLVRIGGKEDPRAHLVLNNGEDVRMSVTVEFAQSLAPYLYKEIAVRGTAEWDILDWSIRKFFPSEVIDEYNPGSIPDAFRQLADACGPEAWKDVDDVVKAIRELREDGNGE